MRTTLIGHIVRIFDTKYIKPTYPVRSFAISYPSSKNIEQVRLVQAIGKENAAYLDKIKLNDRVEITVELRGKIKNIISYRTGQPTEVIANVDECYHIKKL